MPAPAPVDKVLGAGAGAPNRKRRRIRFLAKRRPDRPDQDAALKGGKRELAGPREQSTGLDVFVCDGRCSIQIYAVKERAHFLFSIFSKFPHLTHWIGGNFETNMDSITGIS